MSRTVDYFVWRRGRLNILFSMRRYAPIEGVPFFPDSTALDRPHAVHEGSTVRVAHFDVLPANILEKCPDIPSSPTGYMLKEYHVGGSTADSHLFRYDGDGQKVGNVATLELHEKAAILARRQQVVREYFSEVLPNFVVSSHFFIARSSADEHVFTMYEIQPFEKDYVNPKGGVDERVSAYLTNLSDEQRKVLMHEIEMFKEKFGKLCAVRSDDFHGLIPDLHENNVILSADGHLRTYDTNLYRDRDDHSLGIHMNYLFHSLITILCILDPAYTFERPAAFFARLRAEHAGDTYSEDEE